MAPRNKQAKKEQNAAIRSQLKFLKSKGLYSGDLRKPLTAYAKRLVKSEQFADIFTGKAQVVTAKSKSQAAKYSGTFVTKGNKVIVPKAEGVARFTKKGELRVGGKAAPPIRMSKKPRPGQKGVFRVVIKSLKNNSETIAFVTDDLKEVHAFLITYQKITPEAVEIRFSPE